MFYSPDHNIIVYDHLSDDHTKYLLHVKPLTNGYSALPATLNNIQLLSYFGYYVPRIMERDYDWPGRFKPFEAQLITANFLAIHRRGFVLSDMGTGKTLSALWAADYIMHHEFRAIIVCPLSIVERVWGDAIFEHLMGRRSYVILHGSKQKRLELLAQPHDFYIINFDGVATIREELVKRNDIQLVIIDEASAYRDATTVRHRVMRKTLQLRKYFWAMTGTPVSNGPLDAYGLAKLVNNAYGEAFTHYKDRVMTRISNFKWVPKSGAHEEVNKLLQPSIRFSIDECVDLPSSIVEQRSVELSPGQAKAYKEMKDDCILYVKENRITAVNEGVMRLKLIQIACGAIYGPEREVHHLDAQPRISELHSIIEECREKIIIFAPLTSVIHMLKKALSKYNTEVINGEVSPKNRAEIFRRFQDETDPRILIADPGTMAHGLTLVAATCIIWYAPTDRTELYLQANARINRPGQTKNTVIVQLAAAPIEREIYKRLQNNESLQGLILKLAKGEEYA
jgi:SNF2 family DNA or RNA helicase